MGSARILVVEDDADIRRSLQILLERAGYELTWSADGAEGLQTLLEERHQLIVLDISLPTMGGSGTTRGGRRLPTEPFSNAELVARVWALLRRSPPAGKKSPIYDDGRLRVDMADHSCLWATWK
jgi:DNA-binding response OmpR family regulator